MKKLGLSLLMMLFVGVGTSMAQDKAAAANSDAAVVKTEETAKKSCTAAEQKACCAKKMANAEGKTCSGSASASAEGKKACAKECEKPCCMADAKATTKEPDESHEHDH